MTNNAVKRLLTIMSSL